MMQTEVLPRDAATAHRHLAKIVFRRAAGIFPFTKSPFGGLNGDCAKVRFKHLAAMKSRKYRHETGLPLFQSSYRVSTMIEPQTDLSIFFYLSSFYGIVVPHYASDRAFMPPALNPPESLSGITAQQP